MSRTIAERPGQEHEWASGRWLLGVRSPIASLVITFEAGESAPYSEAPTGAAPSLIASAGFDAGAHGRGHGPPRAIARR